MYRLIKIKELKGFRFFKNYKWDEVNCKLFGKNNLVYGWNGSGKSTLCDFFLELESRQLTDNRVKTSLLFQNVDDNTTKIVTHNSLETAPYIFKVFHQNYIQDTISKVDNIQHIYTVGEGQKNRIDELNSLRKKSIDENISLKTIEKNVELLKNEFEKFKSSKAAQIKNAANYGAAYNKNKFYNAYKSLKEPIILTDEEYQKATITIISEKKDKIIPLDIDFLKPTVKDYIHDILIQTPVNVAIESLRDDHKISSWVEEGLNIHEDRDLKKCQFCGNDIQSKRIDALKLHFNTSYKELSNKINTTISMLNTKIQELDTVTHTLPEPGLFYNEFRHEYSELKNRIEKRCENDKAIIENIINILLLKKSDMINEQYTSEFDNAFAAFSFDYSDFTLANKIIQKHNNKSEYYEQSIKSAQHLIERHLISLCIPEIKKFEDKINEQNLEIINKQDSNIKLDKQIEKLEKKIRNSLIAAELINKDITFIMGRNELKFIRNPIGYQITRNGQLAEHLSKGEENAIALIYFFNSFLNIDTDIKNTIVVLDDPISSFDSNFYYNAISYISEKTKEAGQLFIFTHKFSVFKDFTLMYNGGLHKYLIKRENMKPVLQNEDSLISEYYDEYAYLFKQIYQFVKRPPNNPSEFLIYPNIARRLLEGFLAFKLPNNDTSYNKVQQLEEGKNTVAGCAILRLVNNHSHFRIIPDGESTEDVSNIANLPHILEQLLKFIETHDKKHYNVLVEKCNLGSNVSTLDEIRIDPMVNEKKIVKLYNMPASKGSGAFFLEDNDACEEIEVENNACTYAVRISGNSMEPYITDQSIVLVKQTELVPHACIGIFILNGETFCKKKIDKGDHILLASINKAHKPIIVNPHIDEFRTLGEVIDILANQNIKTLSHQ